MSFKLQGNKCHCIAQLGISDCTWERRHCGHCCFGSKRIRCSKHSTSSLSGVNVVPMPLSVSDDRKRLPDTSDVASQRFCGLSLCRLSRIDFNGVHNTDFPGRNGQALPGVHESEDALYPMTISAQIRVILEHRLSLTSFCRQEECRASQDSSADHFRHP